jgi:hypothetical protein
MDNEHFLGLSIIAWTAISSIATSLAVITALFIPLVDRNRRRLNIFKNIENEIDRNIDIINKASNIDESYLPFINAPNPVKKGFILQDIRTHYWDENKQYVSEYSNEKYIEYSQINTTIKETRDFANEVLSLGADNPQLNYIEIALERACSYIKSLIKYREKVK